MKLTIPPSRITAPPLSINGYMLSYANISLRAKGLYCHILSHSEKVSQVDIVRNHPDSADDVEEAVMELINAGYITPTEEDEEIEFSPKLSLTVGTNRAVILKRMMLWSRDSSRETKVIDSSVWFKISVLQLDRCCAIDGVEAMKDDLRYLEDLDLLSTVENDGYFWGKVNIKGITEIDPEADG